MNPNNAISQSIELIEAEIKRLQAAVNILKGVSENTSIESVTVNSMNNDVIKSNAGIDIKGLTLAQIRNMFLDYLRTVKRFVHTSEVSAIIAKENNLTVEEEKELSRNIGVAIGPLKQSKTIVKIQTDASNLYTYWGSPDWKLDEKTAKEGHQQNRNFPKTNKVEQIKIE